MDFPRRVQQFIDALGSEYPHWQTDLEKFFDDIGFTDAYIQALVPSASSRVQSVKDNIWGMIEFDRPIASLIDNPLLQRLRDIRQLGFSFYTYPTATHSRFNHALGVYAVTQRLIAEIERTEGFRNTSQADLNKRLKPEKLNSAQSAILSRAAILHDIGHGPFSHASERIFGAETEANRYTFGSIPIRRLKYIFRSTYVLSEEDVEDGSRPKGRKPLSEIVTVLFVCSRRFIKFYDRHIGNSNFEGLHDVFSISALVLGDPILENDFALPAMISSAIDADKIDYMLRDADACGIPLSIDVARAFHNAGIYRTPKSLDPFFKGGVLGGTGDVRVFVIDKSGSDTYEQLGASRLSLYRRVYHHQFTRNAEEHFQELIEALASKSPVYGDLLHVWKLDENTLLREGLKSRGRAKDLSLSFSWRRFPKKAAVIDHSSFLSLFAARHPGQKGDDYFAMFIASTLLDLILSKGFLDKLKTRLKALGSELAPPMGLATIPRFIRLLPPPSPDEAVLNATRVIDRASQELIVGETRLPSYMEAGRTHDDKAFLIIDEHLRDIGALALAVEIADWFIHLRRPPAELRHDADLPTKPREASWPNAFVPLLSFDGCANNCKVNKRSVRRMLGTLEAKYPDEPLYWLLNDDPEHEMTAEEVPSGLQIFDGAGGWKVDVHHVNMFLRQFPTDLRVPAFRLLGKLRVLSPSETAKGIQDAVSKLPIDASLSNLHVVPLTATSGHSVLSCLKGYALEASLPISIHNSILEALSAALDGEGLMFVDDHSASGTQAVKQLKAFLGERSPDEPNIFSAPLGEFNQRRLKSLPMFFAFACLGDEGANRLATSAAELGLNVAGVAGGVRLAEVSQKGKISPKLKEFLQKVGTGVMLNAWRSGGKKALWEKMLERARKHALGYDEYQGTLVTTVNVPTSTYTALWRPGSYDPSGNYDAPGSLSQPWVPLLIRNTQIARMVIF